MKQINNVLIGVDLSDGDKLVSDELAPTTVEAVELGLRLANYCDARAHFFYSLDIGAQAQRSIQEDDQAEATILDKAQRELRKLVKQAKKEGVVAEAVATFGKSWIEITKYAVQHNCDSVVVGAKQHGALEEFFIGSTGMNLLRNCPCPVWVTHPRNAGMKRAVLVCHDLTEVGEQALEFGAAVAAYRKVPLEVIHVVEPQTVNIADPLTVEVSETIDRQSIRDRINKEIDALDTSPAATIHILDGSPATAIQDFLKQHPIDLLVLGTLARSGVQGLLIGNTAERLLTQVSCSVLAVKPEGFESPIAVD